MDNWPKSSGRFILKGSQPSIMRGWVRIESGSREWSKLISNSFLQKENKERLEKFLELKQKQLE